MMRMVLPGLKDIAITVSRMSLREKQYHDKYRWGLNSLSRSYVRRFTRFNTNACVR